MKRQEQIIAKAALLSAFMGIICILALLFPNDAGTNFFISLYMVFFGIAILLGGISLLIKRNTLAWIAFSIGCFFVLVLVVLIFLLKDMCVIC